MKKVKSKIFECVSVSVLIFVFTLNVNAQNFEAGLRFMPTFSSFHMKSTKGESVTGEGVIGFGVGGFVAYNFSEHIGIQGELIYSSHSQKFTELDVERKVNLGYINIPLLFSYNTGKYDPINFNFVAGPQLGLSAGSNVFTTDVLGHDRNPAILRVKLGDLGFAYGAGVDFGLNKSQTYRLAAGFRGGLRINRH
jgi:hypothetical protein